MPFGFFQKTAFSRKLLLKIARPRAKASVEHFAQYLRDGESIVDIGAGLCDITQLLRQKGHAVTPLDVQDFSMFTDIKPVVYSGERLPFADKSFDTALILTVLHHTPEPVAVLREARRVARRIIIIEDVFYNAPHKYATFFMDSLLNLELWGHPHSNKTDQAWRALFTRLDLRITEEKAFGSFAVLRHRLYILEPTE